MKTLKLSMGDIEFPEKLTPNQVESIRNKTELSKNGSVKNIGSWLWEIPKQIVKNMEIKYDDLTTEDRDKIAYEYIEMVRGFLPK